MRPLESLRSRTGETDARARELQTAIAGRQGKIEANALKIAEMERVRGDNQQKIAAAEEIIRLPTRPASKRGCDLEAGAGKPRPDRRARADERRDGPLAERRTAAENELNDTNSKLWEEYQLTERGPQPVRAV